MYDQLTLILIQISRFNFELIICDCLYKVYPKMSLTNVEIMKQTIGLDSYEDEWIQNSMVSTSPYGDFIVISSSACAVFYIKKMKP